MTATEQPRPRATLPVGTRIIYRQGKRLRAGHVHAVGRFHYQLLMDDGSELMVCNLENVTERFDPGGCAPPVLAR